MIREDRKFLSSPAVTLMTDLGPVKATFVDEHRVSVTTDAHVNDDKPTIVHRGQDYLIHLFVTLDDTGAVVGIDDDWPHYTRRPQWDKPGWTPSKTAKSAIDAAVVNAVRACLEADPDMPARAMFVSANNEWIRLQEDRDKLMREVNEIDLKAMNLRKRLGYGLTAKEAGV